MQLYVDPTIFQDYPIEFKEINPEDFLFGRDIFQVENNGEKIVIEPNEQGFINDVLQSKLNLEHKNTVVINAAVGQGKSYAIIQTIKRYYDKMQEEDQQYLIFVASPFVSLVKQYCEDIEKAGVPNDKIYNYNGIGRTQESFLDKPIQVITVNTLLGNPGEDGFKNSDAKREYLNSLLDHCETNDVKVIFIYDELHDSFHNFKQEYIFNLWKWKSVIHKNFVISATFNEASKIIIEYLTELTDFKLKLIESKRIVYPDMLSELYLHFSTAHNFTTETPEIKNVITDIVNSGKRLDVLTYSKKLAKSIINPNEYLGKLLKMKSGEINDCTSQLITNQRTENEEPKNQYDNNKCNIGTNFKTGVSVKKDNHAFVIIMPPRATRLWFRNKYGIFSGGINSVIQALARKRTKGEIHIILPKPDKMDYNTLEHTEMTLAQKEEFIKLYNNIEYYKEPKKKVKYIKLNSQDFFMRSFYENTLKANVIHQIEELSSSSRSHYLPKLDYPTYKEFKLENGEDYLASNMPFYGEDISAYITYGAITNQFINCRLKEIHIKPVIIFNEGQINSKLKLLYNMFMGDDRFWNLKSFANFKLFFNELKTLLENDFELKLSRLDTGNIEDIKPKTTAYKKFILQLLQFAHNLWYYIKQDADLEYSRADYLLSCITHTKDFNVDEISCADYKKRVTLYQLINKYRLKLLDSVMLHQIGNRNYFYLPIKPSSNFFTVEDVSEIERVIALADSDSVLKNDVFNFSRRLKQHSSIESKLNAFYSILKEDFVNLDSQQKRITINEERVRINKVISTPTLPHKRYSLDLVSNEDYNYEILDINRA